MHSELFHGNRIVDIDESCRSHVATFVFLFTLPDRKIASKMPADKMMFFIVDWMTLTYFGNKDLGGVRFVSLDSRKL